MNLLSHQALASSTNISNIGATALQIQNKEMAQKSAYFQLDIPFSSCDRKNYFTSSSRRCVLPPNPHPKFDISVLGNPPPTLDFALPDLCDYLMIRLKKDGIIREAVANPFIVGGASMNILGEIVYADEDLCIYISQPSFKQILQRISTFVSIALWKQHHIKADPLKMGHIIIEAYLYKKMIFTDENGQPYGSYIGLGVGCVDLKFYLEPPGWFPDQERDSQDGQQKLAQKNSKCRYNVSAIDGFHIAFYDNFFFCVDGSKRCDEVELKEAVDGLQQRFYIIKEPEKVRELVWRVFLQLSKGFSIKDQLHIIKIALQQLLLEFPLDTDPQVKVFTQRLHHYLDHHYPKDPIGKSIGFLNFLYVILHEEKQELRRAYAQALGKAWLDSDYRSTECCLLDHFAALLQKVPELSHHLLACVQGSFLLEWSFGGKAISNQAYPSISVMTQRPCWHLMHSKRVQHIAISSTPDHLACQFLKGYLAIEHELGEQASRSLMEEICSNFGLASIVMESSHRQVIVQKLMKAFKKEPLSTLITSQFPKIHKYNAFDIALIQEFSDILPKEVIVQHRQVSVLQTYLTELKAIRETQLEALVIYIITCIHKSQPMDATVMRDMEEQAKVLNSSIYLNTCPALRQLLTESLLRIIHTRSQEIRHASLLLRAYVLTKVIERHLKESSVEDKLFISAEIAARYVQVCSDTKEIFPSCKELDLLHCLSDAMTVDTCNLEAVQHLLNQALPQVLMSGHVPSFVLTAEIALHCQRHSSLQPTFRKNLRQIADQLIFLIEKTAPNGTLGSQLLQAISDEQQIDLQIDTLRKMAEAVIMNAKDQFQQLAMVWQSIDKRKVDIIFAEKWERATVVTSLIDAAGQLNHSLVKEFYNLLHPLMTDERAQSIALTLIKQELQAGNINEAYRLWSTVPDKSKIEMQGCKAVVHLMSQLVTLPCSSDHIIAIEHVLNDLLTLFHISKRFTFSQTDLNELNANFRIIFQRCPLLKGHQTVQLCLLLWTLGISPDEVDLHSHTLIKVYLDAKVIPPEDLSVRWLVGVNSSQKIEGDILALLFDSFITLKTKGLSEWEYQCSLKLFLRVHIYMDQNRKEHACTILLKAFPSYCKKTENVVIQLKICEDVRPSIPIFIAYLKCCDQLIALSLHDVSRKFYDACIAKYWPIPQTMSMLFTALREVAPKHLFEYIARDVLQTAVLDRHDLNVAVRAKGYSELFQYLSSLSTGQSDALKYVDILDSLWMQCSMNLLKVKSVAPERGVVLEYYLNALIQSGRPHNLLRASELLRAEWNCIQTKKMGIALQIMTQACQLYLDGLTAKQFTVAVAPLLIMIKEQSHLSDRQIEVVIGSLWKTLQCEQSRNIYPEVIHYLVSIYIGNYLTNHTPKCKRSLYKILNTLTQILFELVEIDDKAQLLRIAKELSALFPLYKKFLPKLAVCLVVTLAKKALSHHPETYLEMNELWMKYHSVILEYPQPETLEIKLRIVNLLYQNRSDNQSMNMTNILRLMPDVRNVLSKSNLNEVFWQTVFNFWTLALIETMKSGKVDAFNIFISYTTSFVEQPTISISNVNQLFELITKVMVHSIYYLTFITTLQGVSIKDFEDHFTALMHSEEKLDQRLKQIAASYALQVDELPNVHVVHSFFRSLSSQEVKAVCAQDHIKLLLGMLTQFEKLLSAIKNTHLLKKMKKIAFILKQFSQAFVRINRIIVLK